MLKKRSAAATATTPTAELLSDDDFYTFFLPNIEQFSAALQAYY